MGKLYNIIIVYYQKDRKIQGVRREIKTLIIFHREIFFVICKKALSRNFWRVVDSALSPAFPTEV